jgi:hypothetical protein
MANRKPANPPGRDEEPMKTRRPVRDAILVAIALGFSAAGAAILAVLLLRLFGS